MHPRSSGFRTASAYTLIEVLMVVAIIGLAAAVVVPNMLSAGTLGIQAAARIVIADMLHAQNEAMARQSERRVVFEADPVTLRYRYRIVRLNDAGQEETILDASGRPFEVDFAKDSRFSNIAIESLNFWQGNGDGTHRLVFDEMGGAREVGGGRLVLRQRQERYEIRVAPFTGRVTVHRDGA